MADREKNARAQLKLRLPEPIRARLEAEAEQNGYSLNWEVVRRLDQSIKDDDLGKFLFGTRDKFFAAYYFAGIIETLEQKTGKFLTEDPAIFEMAVDAMQHSSIAGIMLPGIGSLGLLMTGRALGGTREVLEIAANGAIERRSAREKREADNAA